MEPTIIDGRAKARGFYQGLRPIIESFVRPPGLAVVLVGEDPASKVYVSKKEAVAHRLGLSTTVHRLGADASEVEVLSLLADLNEDDQVHGILVQLPLPPHIDARAVIETIDPWKDVDGLHPENTGLLSQGAPRYTPCTPLGVMHLLEDWTLLGIEAVVVGASDIVGRPMAMCLEQAGATVTVCHRKTRGLKAHVARAELLVVATGVPHLIKGLDIQEGAIVIDVGITRLPDGNLVGDVEYDAALPRVHAITPVPGGVGPMTVAMLMGNTVQAASAQGLQVAERGHVNGGSGSV